MSGMSAYISKWSSTRIIAVAIIAVVLSVYAPSLKNGFVHDDEGQIVENPYVQSLKYIPKAFTSCIWEAYLGTCRGTTNYYRPLHTLSYQLTYFVSSSAAWFHLVNLLYYAALCLAVWVLLKELIPNRLAALLALGLFIVHPVHSEAVIWIAAVPELLYSLFAVLSIWAYLIKWPGEKWSMWWVGGFFFAALLAKEPAVFVPVILIAYDFLWKKGNIFKAAYLFKYWAFPVMIAFYALMRYLSIDSLRGRGRTDVYEMSFVETIFTTVFVFGEYVKKVLWPYELNPFIPFEPVTAASDPRFWENMIITVVFLSVFAWAIYAKEKVITLGFIIYLSFLAPALLFLNAVGENVIAERYLLLPSLGIIIIVGCLLSRIYEKFDRKPLGFLAFALVVILVIISIPLAYAQNKVWATSKDLYEYAHKLNARQGHIADLSYYNLAVIYENEGRVDKAKEAYENITSDPGAMSTAHKAYNNLGKIYHQEGRFQEAVDMYEKSIKTKSDHKSAYNNLAITYMENGMYKKALHSYMEVLRIDPFYQEGLHNLNILYQRVSELMPYKEDGSPGELHAFLTGLLKDAKWKNWEYRRVERERAQETGSRAVEGLRLQSIQPQLSGAIEVTLDVNPGLPFNISPNLLFYTVDGEVNFIMNQFKRFDPEISEISLLILPVEEEGEKTEVNLYIILSDFRYYVFDLTSPPQP